MYCRGKSTGLERKQLGSEKGKIKMGWRVKTVRTTQEATGSHLDAGNTLISDTRLAVLITDPLYGNLNFSS